MIGFFNAHDCKVAASLVVSIHKGPIEASCYEWDPFEHETPVREKKEVPGVCPRRRGDRNVPRDRRTH
jgi:hypothetical protein